jgi:hypothetical protein
MSAPIDKLGNKIMKGDFVEVELPSNRVFGTIVELHEGGIVASSIISKEPARQRITPTHVKILFDIDAICQPGEPFAQVVKVVRPDRLSPPKEGNA